MTAELFIKLAAQLYSECKTQTSDSETESLQSDSENIYSAPEEYLREHRESNGGVKIKPEENLIDLDSNLDDTIDSEVKTQQWLPKMTSKFWVKYVNKLRVNASEEGVCDLAERDEDGNDADIRRQL